MLVRQPPVAYNSQLDLNNNQAWLSHRTAIGTTKSTLTEWACMVLDEKMEGKADYTYLEYYLLAMIYGAMIWMGYEQDEVKEQNINNELACYGIVWERIKSSYTGSYFFYKASSNWKKPFRDYTPLREATDVELGCELLIG